MSEPTEPVAAQAPQSAAQTPASAAAQAPDQDAPSTTAQAAPPEAEPAQATATEPEPGPATGPVAEASSEPVADDEAPFAVDTPDDGQGKDAAPGDGESDLEKSAAPGASDAAAPASPDAGTAAAAEMGPAACAARLGELFQALFGSDGPPRPVKLRIHADIQQRAPGVFTRKALSIFLHRHTTGNAYLRALLNAPHRFDLDGQPAGEVLEEHRVAAREELERRRQIHLARRAAERATGGRPPGAQGADAAPNDGTRTAGPRPERSGRPPRGMGPETRGHRGPREPRAAFGPGASQGPTSAATEGDIAAAAQPRGEPSAGPGGPPTGRDRRPPRPMREAQGADPGGRTAQEARNAGGRHADGDAGRRRGGGEPGSGRGGPQGRHRGPMDADRPSTAARPFHAGPAGPGGRDRPQPRRPDGESHGPATGADRPAAGPEDAARRERASLLRTYEASSLSKANFCVLKRMNETDLDAVLVQARRERDERGPRPMTPAA